MCGISTDMSHISTTNQYCQLYHLVINLGKEIPPSAWSGEFVAAWEALTAAAIEQDFINKVKTDVAIM